MDHNFGGAHTLLKLDILKEYLNAYVQVMKNQKWCSKVYIDAFSGTGSIQITDDNDNPLRTDGSAKIAIEVSPSFDKYFFIDSKQVHINALRQLVDTYPNIKSKVEFHVDNANNQLPIIINSLSNFRGVLFIDPFGMQFEWETLKMVAKTGNLDVWYLFPLSGLFRNIPREEKDLEGEKKQAITRLLGDEDWYKKIYAPPKQKKLFGESSQERDDWGELVNFTTSRLKEIFAEVSNPKILKNKKNIPIFALYFAVSNPSRNAINRAMDIANHLLKD